MTTQAVIVQSIGAAVSILKLATKEPITAPTPKRTLPINELAVPAIVGNFSRIEAVALDDINGFCPTKKATPIAIGQKPKSKSAVKNNRTFSLSKLSLQNKST